MQAKLVDIGIGTYIGAELWPGVILVCLVISWERLSSLKQEQHIALTVFTSIHLLYIHTKGFEEQHKTLEIPATNLPTRSLLYFVQP